ncbi:MAG: hypothetical protein B6D44_09070 [Ignavibacteriales bacterium UTCHB2]|jgi:NhaP-type Na+/H+ or K+/H+ antiporter|nr:MAG: hypothetical protein B6D44_09070 [Ignavibacteriales bacterium UTCHB2]
METLIIIWFICSILNFLLCKKIRGKDPDNNTWVDVILTLFISVFGVIGTIAIVIAFIEYFASDINFPNKPKPPRWL